MRRIIYLTSLVLLAAGLSVSADVDPRKRLNSISSARVLAQRSIVETVYGVKIRFIEEVTDLSEGNFLGTTETKTGKRSIKGIEFIEKYDPVNDIAQVTAVLKLKRIADIIDPERFQLDKFPEKSIRRVAFASSTPASAIKLGALRAAEIEAYKNLYKTIGGFTLESQSKVENFVLKSDKVKASVIGAVMGAEYMGFAWEGKGANAVAVVKLRMDLQELATMLGEKIVDFDGRYVEAEGRAAQRQAEEKKKASTSDDATPRRINIGVVEGNVDVMP